MKKNNLRNAFISGVIVVIPLGITIFALQFIFKFLDNISGQYFRKILPFYIPGIGIITSLILIILLGIFINNWFGRTFYGYLERRIMRIPLLGSLYTVSRQIVEFIGTSRQREFQKVIYLQYPAKGIWTLGFVTGQSLSSDGVRIYNVFVPTTPNPTSGYMVFIPVSEAVETKYTIEEGLKILISGGMLAPDTLPFHLNPPQQHLRTDMPIPPNTQEGESS